MDDMKSKGRHKTNIGGEDRNIKLTHYDIPIIRELFRVGFTRRFLAKRFGVNKKTISDVARGRTWKHIPPLSLESNQLTINDWRCPNE
jgi:hypothetical protein